jgi:hypothetical protein
MTVPPASSPKGNFVTEWFGHRVWPHADTSDAARIDQSARACPFLTTVTGAPTACVKTARGWSEPYGICTISSDSNGLRQDWIACPYRTLDQHFTLLSGAIRSLYRLSSDEDMVVLPVTVLSQAEQRARLRSGLDAGYRVFVFSTNKLGGEIELPETEVSPGASVDMSVIEVMSADETGRPTNYGNHLFYEIQTADFHGSPLHAASHLRDLCPAGEPVLDFHARLFGREAVCGDRVEGPNKSNIFKRTIYQMLFKIALADHARSAGFAIVLPVPVWDSWLRHLGRPELSQVGHDPTHVAMLAPGERVQDVALQSHAAILVFDIDQSSNETPQPLTVIRHVWCSSAALTYFTFDFAAQQARQQKVVERFRTSMVNRVGKGVSGQLDPQNKPARAPRGTKRPQGESTSGDETVTVITASGDVHPDD